MDPLELLSILNLIVPFALIASSVPLAVRQLQLRRYGIKQANHWHLHGFRIRIEVKSAENVDQNIFVYRRSPPDPVTGVVFDEFMTVVSFVDLTEYPVGAPDPASGVPFFRQNFVELDTRSVADTSTVWTTVVLEAENLLKSLAQAETLVHEEDITIGEGTATGDSLVPSETIPLP